MSATEAVPSQQPHNTNAVASPGAPHGDRVEEDTLVTDSNHADIGAASGRPKPTSSSALSAGHHHRADQAVQHNTMRNFQ